MRAKTISIRLDNKMTRSYGLYVNRLRMEFEQYDFFNVRDKMQEIKDHIEVIKSVSVIEANLEYLESVINQDKWYSWGGELYNVYFHMKNLALIKYCQIVTSDPVLFKKHEADALRVARRAADDLIQNRPVCYSIVLRHFVQSMLNLTKDKGEWMEVVDELKAFIQKEWKKDIEF